MIRLRDILTENTDNTLPAEQCLLDNGYKYSLPGGGDRSDADWESQKTDLRKKGFFMKKKDGNSSIIVKILPIGFNQPGNKIILGVKGGSKTGFPIKFKFTTCDDLKQRIANEIDKVNQSIDPMPLPQLYKPRTKKNPIPRGNLKL